jgi:hypothetical protein
MWKSINPTRLKIPTTPTIIDGIKYRLNEYEFAQLKLDVANGIIDKDLVKFKTYTRVENEECIAEKGYTGRIDERGQINGNINDALLHKIMFQKCLHNNK